MTQRNRDRVPTIVTTERGVGAFSRLVVTSFLWQGGAQLAGQVISWIGTIAVIRLLSPGDYGTMAIANMLFGLFLIIADLGFGAAMVQAAELDRNKLRQIFGFVLVLNFGAAVATLLSASVIASFFDDARLTPIIRVLSVNFLLIAAYILPQALLLRKMDFRTKGRIDIAVTFFATGITLILALFGYGVWSLVIGTVSFHAVKALLLNLFASVKVLPSFHFESVNSLGRFGALTALSSLLFFIYGQADIVIGARILGTETLGLYAVALSLAAIPMEKVLPVITQVSFAAFSRIQSDSARVNRNMLRSVRLVSVACFPACLGLAATASEFVPLVLGERWIEIVLPFQILCFAVPLKAVGSLFAPPLYGIGRAGVNVAIMVISLVVMGPALLLGVQYGVVGLALAWLVGYPVAFAAMMYCSLAALRVSIRDFVLEMLRPALASLLMFVVVGQVSAGIGGSVQAFPKLALLVLIGAVSYAALAVALSRDALLELYRLVRPVNPPVA